MKKAQSHTVHRSLVNAEIKIPAKGSVLKKFTENKQYMGYIFPWRLSHM